MIQRKIKNKILEVAERFQVIAIFGPRQSGKTTLSKLAFPDYSYKNLEDPSEREFASSDPKSFLKDAEKGMIIDEVQRTPELLSYIQAIVDENKNVKFIITGSQNYLLLEKISQSLAGRVFLQQLLPFSISEIEKLYHPSDYTELIYKGFFPPIYDRNIPVSDWMPSYIQTYLERDVREIKNITNQSAFTTFLRLCAGRVGQTLNLNSLGSEAGINDKTSKSWVSVLETGFVIYLLKPYHKNFRKRLTKSPKLYFVDTGLASSLLNIKNADQADTHFLKGGLFENLVILEVLKYFVNRGEKPELYYWRDNHGNEIDLLFERDDKIYAIEIKAGRTITSSFFKGLNYFEKIAGSQSIKKFLIYGGDQIQQRKEANVLPWFAAQKIFEL